MAKELEIKNIENMALFYLERFPTSKGHFLKVMKRKIKRKCEKKDIPLKPEYFDLLEKVTTKMENYGYLDDTRYINAMIQSSLSRGQSIKKIQAKLFSKSISSEKIQTAIDQFKNDNIDIDLLAGIKFIKKKKIGCFCLESYDQIDDLLKRKWLQKLAMAGFNYQTATRLMDITIEEAELILDQTF